MTALLKNITAIVALMATLQLSAQVGIGETEFNPDTSALVEIKSSSKGILIPRLTTTQRKAIANPAEGLILFDLDYITLFYFDKSYSSGSDGWSVLDPWYFRDNERSYSLTKTIYERDVIAHTNVTSMSIGTQTPVANTVTVVDNVAVGSATIIAPTEGLAVEEEIEAEKNLTVTGNLKADELTGFGTMPVGGIIMWSGDLVTLPDGWELCDGGTVNGVAIPDLRGKFIVGHGTTQNVATSDVAKTYNDIDEGGEHFDQLSVNEMPNHTHGAETTSDGNHRHSYTDTYYNTGGGTGDDTCLAPDCSCCDDSYAVKNSVSDDTTPVTADDGLHLHTIADQGGDETHENRPSYYVLAYLIRVE